MAFALARPRPSAGGKSKAERARIESFVRNYTCYSTTVLFTENNALILFWQIFAMCRKLCDLLKVCVWRMASEPT